MWLFESQKLILKSSPKCGHVIQGTTGHGQITCLRSAKAVTIQIAHINLTVTALAVFSATTILNAGIGLYLQQEAMSIWSYVLKKKTASR